VYTAKIVVLANNMVLWLRDYPSHANSKNAVLVKYLMGRWWGLLKCSANSVRHYGLPLQPQYSFNYHGKDSLALSFPCVYPSY